MDKEYIKEYIADDGAYFFEEENPVIDVAASVHYRRQTPAYTEAYRKWRSDEKNAFAYNFVEDTREHTYRNGSGFIQRHPSLAEKKSIYRNMNLLGIILIGVLVWDALGVYLFVQVTRLFGSGVRYDHWNGLSLASDGYRLACLTAVMGVELLLPIVALKRFLKLPGEVLFPTKICNPAMHGMALPLAVILFVTLHRVSELYGGLLNKAGLEMRGWAFFIPDSLPLEIASALLQVVLLSALWEVFIHGAVMQSLRQFGDGFALVVSSAIFTLLCHDGTRLFYCAIMSLIIGYYVLCTGSLRTGILMRTLIMAGEYIVYRVEYALRPEEAGLYVTALQFILIAAGLAALFIYCRDKQKMLSFAMPKTYVSVREKILCSLNTLPVMLWIILVILLSIGTLEFKM